MNRILTAEAGGVHCRSHTFCRPKSIFRSVTSNCSQVRSNHKLRFLDCNALIQFRKNDE